MSIGSHQSARSLTQEWVTPRFIIDELGPFDLDPCSPFLPPWPTADRHYTLDDDGLRQLWHGRVWLNPPYGPPPIVSPWMQRLASHGYGTALIFARTETAMFFETVWDQASAILFLRGRLHFHYVNGTRAKANAGAPSVLIAYGQADANRLETCKIAGKFLRLR